MIVKFSCHLCGLHRVECEVPDRVAGQDVRDWMTATTILVSRNHDLRSPGCHPTTMTELMIPVDNRAYIGGPIVH